MEDKCITLDEFLDQYLLYEKADINDDTSDLFDYENWDTYLKNQKKQELFESLIKRLNLLFELDLSDKQLVEKRFPSLNNENIKDDKSDDELVAAFDDITPIEQEFFTYLLNNIDRTIDGIDILHSLENYDWRPISKEIRSNLQVYLKKLSDSNSYLFNTLIPTEDLFYSAYLKLENPRSYFFQRSILAILEAPDTMDRYSEQLRKPYQKEIDSYLKEREKLLQAIERKLKKIIVHNNKLIKKLSTDKDKLTLQFMRLKKKYCNSSDLEEKKQLEKHGEKILKHLELSEDNELDEKISSMLDLLLEKED